MVLKNIKPEEEFNNRLYFEKLNQLIKDLVTTNKEMGFLKETQETIKNIETFYCKKVPLDDPVTHVHTIGSCADPKNSYLSPNIFYTLDGDEFILTKTQNIRIYEHLIKENIKIKAEDQPLYDIIEKSIQYIYKKKKSNLETELLKFLNVPTEILTFYLMQELNNLIKYHPNNKSYNIHNTRLKLTTLSYKVGQICLDVFCKSHPDYFVRELLNSYDENTKEQQVSFVENMQQYKQIKHNADFMRIFNLTLEKRKKKG